MTDIVERLRADAEMSRDCSSNWEAFDCSEAMREAAAEIERLRLSISEARATGRREGMEEAVRIAEKVGRSVGAGDGATCIPGTSAQASAAIRAAMEKE